MKRTGRKKEWSILLFCVFALGIFPPALFVFDKQVLVLGSPLSFLYLFGLWTVMIFFIAIGAKRRKIPPLPERRFNTGLQGSHLEKTGPSDDV